MDACEMKSMEYSGYMSYTTNYITGLCQEILLREHVLDGPSFTYCHLLNLDTPRNNMSECVECLSASIEDLHVRLKP